MTLVFEKRKTVSKTAIVVVPFISFAVSLVLTGVLLVTFGANPFETFAAMFKGAFGSGRAFTETLVKAIPLMLTGLGVALAFKLRFWNIGAEGQLTLAGVAATWVAVYWSPWLPAPILLPMLVLVGCAAGALWAGIPALLKTSLKVDETLVTLMLNYVAILISQFLYYGPWRDPKGFGFPGTEMFPKAAWFPRIAGRAHIGLYFALVAAAVLWFVLQRTRWGFELKVIGNSPKAARYQGISVERNILLAVLLSGALCGLAGVGEVAGISRRLQQGLSLGYGYTAIIVAWMAQLNPLAIPFVAIIMGGLLVGGDQVQMVMGLPSSMGLLMQGMMLFPMLAGSLFTEYRIKRMTGTQTREAARGGV
ncbi:MAG: ABC transporter permease [Spirochaetae bacterium HGW-Spirochaetae-7]|jgi:simple sugar transport system permease protein|nr:MAG: ABC transporter permease [Spirochaetae bacterium HGW-Spirochaetae-7]